MPAAALFVRIACPAREPHLGRAAMCARRFLVAVFVLTLLVVAAGFAMFQYGGQILIKSAVPRGHFEAAKAGTGPDYSKPASWVARPGIGGDPSAWLPEGASAGEQGQV